MRPSKATVSPAICNAISESALGHERFTGIDEVWGEEGLEVRCTFHSDAWGDFRTCFKPQLDAGGKITRLDIGQA